MMAFEKNLAAGLYCGKESKKEGIDTARNLGCFSELRLHVQSTYTD